MNRNIIAAGLLAVSSIAGCEAMSPAYAVTPNEVYVMGDSYRGVPVECANHRWHYLRPGHKSKCVRTIGFHARFNAPHTSYYDDAGHWQVLRGGTYSTSSRLLLRNGFTV